VKVNKKTMKIAIYNKILNCFEKKNISKILIKMALKREIVRITNYFFWFKSLFYYYESIFIK